MAGAPMKHHAQAVLLAGAESRRRTRVQALLAAARPDLSVRVSCTAASLVEQARAGEIAVVLDDLPDLSPESLLAMEGHSAPCAVVVLLVAADTATELLLLQLGADECLSDDALTTELLTGVIERASARSVHRRASHTSAQAYAPAPEIDDRQTQLALALEASSTGLWTWDMTTDTVTWSLECYRIHGVDRFAGNAPAFFELVHPDDQARVSATVRAAAAQRRPYWCEFRVIRPSGEIVWVENRGRAVHDPSGTPIRMLGTVTDITLRKRAEDAARDAQTELARRERELQTLADNSPDIFTRFDRGLRLVFVNSAVEHVAGRPRDAFIGKTNRELAMPAALCDLWDGALLRVFEHASAESLEFAFDSGEQTRLFEARLVPEFDEAGRVTHVLGVTRDVTERHRYVQALRDADRRKDEFMATLAHELRNPFATLANGLDLLKHAPSGERVVRTLAAMERQLRQGIRLIEDLLDASGIALGKWEFRPERVSLGAVVEDALEATRGVVEAAAHSLQLHVQSDPIYVHGDAARLTQVVSNLVTNAAKYTPRGGTIAVNLSADDALAELEVSDSGMGIPSEMLDQVFVLFSQVKHNGDGAHAGLGIGLAVVKSLVEIHGGSVAVRSPGAGRGSTFTVRLPLGHAG
jgi:PAS domain S-box-containing protein